MIAAMASASDASVSFCNKSLEHLFGVFSQCCSHQHAVSCRRVVTVRAERQACSSEQAHYVGCLCHCRVKCP